MQGNYSHDRLICELTMLDAREAKRPHHNPYAIAHYFRAADGVREDVEAGADPGEAFAAAFTPTRGNHGIAKRLDLGLDVQRGQWVR